MKMKSAEFISLSASTMILTALGIDIMLPALSEVRQYFDLPPTSTTTSQIIVFFFMGQVAQIVFGVFSDHYGRLPILRIGFPLYIISGIAAAFAPTLEFMFVARFISGVGASAVLMVTIAGVRDRFVGDQMARIMSLIFTIFLFTPVVAPFLGIAILSVSSWQLVFLTPPLFALIVFAWSFRLAESLHPENRIALNWATIGQSVRVVVSNRTFLRYTTITTLLFSALSSYVASSERIVGELYERPELFPWIFAGIGLVMSLFALSNSYLSLRYGSRRTLRGLLIIYTVVGGVLLAWMLTHSGMPGMLPFFTAIAIMLGINLAIEPNSSALALQPLGKVAGMASAIYGTIFFFVGSSLGSMISHLMVQSVFPLAFSFFAVGLIATVLAVINRSDT